MAFNPRTVADYPELVETLHPTKNGELRPDKIARGSNKKYWWKCPRGPDHEWQANPLHRTQGRGCPFCAGKRVSVTNALAATHPDIAKQWHRSKNAPLTPWDVVAGSDRRIFWKCPKGDDHEWSAVLSSRTTGQRAGCPFCAGKRPSSTTSLAALLPALAEEWHPTKNLPLSPHDVTLGTERKIWWRCREDPSHAWPTLIMNRRRGAGCPQCRGREVGEPRTPAGFFAGRGKHGGKTLAERSLIASFWHPTKNKGRAPADITAHSRRRVWWKCPKGPDHEFQRSVDAQVAAKHKCPFCADQRVSLTNNIAARYPLLAAEWHPKKNGKLTPDRVGPGSIMTLFWWKCPKGPDHAWRTSISVRKLGIGCPFCSNFRVSVTNSLAALRPDLARQWHPKKNGRLSPSSVVCGANKKAWWRCPKSPAHDYQSKISQRSGSRGSGCPYCAGRRLAPDNSLAARRPDLAAQWHPTKNGSLTPADVTSGSARLAWWVCPKDEDHEWQVAVVQRAQYGCPVCVGRKPPKTRRLIDLYPALAAEWHPKKNGSRTAGDVSDRTTVKVWWRCPKNRLHEWREDVRTRVEGKGRCPFCAGRRIVPDRRRTNSVAAEAPEVALQWHPTRNGSTRPTDVVAISTKRVWWKCRKGPDHEWRAPPTDRIRSGYGCPFCASRRLSVTNCLAARYPRIAAEWHPTRNAPLTPRQIFPSYKEEVSWRCEYGHEWRARPAVRVRDRTRCPVCRVFKPRGPVTRRRIREDVRFPSGSPRSRR
jgi:hypothetical protein